MISEGRLIRFIAKSSLALILFSLVLLSCENTNNPYRAEERDANVYYTTFSEPPKHLDPARAYSSDEYGFLAQIYEPLVQYHYLKRPYELEPLTARSLPAPIYYDQYGAKLSDEAEPGDVARAVYDIEIKKGILYQPHPAFAKKPDGSPYYKKLADEDLKGVDEIRDFAETGTRELTADDYIYQIKRLADPQVMCPILPILEKYIVGMTELKIALKKELEDERARRKEAGGAAYNRALDEKTNPIILDYSIPLEGVQKRGPYSFEIILKSKYPQFVYWLAMPFFAPIPIEADLFYKEPALADRNITLDRFPVGTGAFMIDVFDPHLEITLAANPNFHEERFPTEGEARDRERGLLEDAGKRLPFLKKVVFKLEKESIPRWNKFLQGYFDTSGISNDSFDSAVSISPSGGVDLTDLIKSKGIRLKTSIRPSSSYMGFNMLDETVGGYSPEKQKLRQAISIALDYEEFIEIFINGRGLPAMGPLPPGLFGFEKGENGINPYVYSWNKEEEMPERRSLEEAKRLLTEAGYPGGRDKDGRPLVITFDNAWAGVTSLQQNIDWFGKKLKLIGIQLENRSTDYNRFREKVTSGNFQLFSWGWNADYPDPENFLFLLAGHNGKVEYRGENAANYKNPEFDRLFTKMENMESNPERLEIIRKMTKIAQKDAPWVFGYHPVSFTLQHRWVGNSKSNAMANGTMKYIKIDTSMRTEKRAAWNKPRFMPIIVLFIIIFIIAIPAVIKIRRKLG